MSRWFRRFAQPVLVPGLVLVLVVGLLTAGPATGPTAAPTARAATLLNGHTVRLDASGKLLAWSGTPDQAYAKVAGLAWNYLLTKVPDADENGQPAYLSHSYLDPATQTPVGWPHNPAGLYAMLIESALRWYAYSGDARVITVARRVADHQLADGMTAASDSWSRVPYASGDSGSLTYRGAEVGDTSGSGDGTGVIEPDKIGEFGHGLVQLYKITGKKAYLDAAVNGANALVRHQQKGDADHSPWPFRVVAADNTTREAYTASVTGPLELFDDLIALKKGDVAGYRRARTVLWTWTFAHPMKTNDWSQYFEDVDTQTAPDENLNQLDAMMFARYLLEHPQSDRQWQSHVRGLISWVERTFGERQQGGALTINEQQAFFHPMGSHTSRYAEVNALLYEKTGDRTALDKAYRSFNWATYMARSNGVVIDGPEVNNQWFTDGYADYIRHFLSGMGAMPQYAPAGQTHLLETTSEITRVAYGTHTMSYTAFDRAGHETIKSPYTPSVVRIDGHTVRRTRAAGVKPGSWTYSTGRHVLVVRRSRGTKVTVTFVRPARTAPKPAPKPKPKPTGPWHGHDVGDVGVSGHDSAKGATATVSGSGTDVWGNADAFRFRARSLTADGSITARVLSQQDTDPWALSGLMLRQSLDPGSREVLIATTPGHGLSFDHRDDPNGTTSYSAAGSRHPAVWLRLARRGRTLTASASTDGQHWSTVGRVTLDLGRVVYAGLAVTSHDNTRLGTARFDHIAVVS